MLFIQYALPDMPADADRPRDADAGLDAQELRTVGVAVVEEDAAPTESTTPASTGAGATFEDKEGADGAARVDTPTLLRGLYEATIGPELATMAAGAATTGRLGNSHHSTANHTYVVVRLARFNM